MPAKKKTALYFTTVAAYPGYRVALGGHLVVEGTDPQGTRFMLYTGTTWGHHDDIGVIVYAMEIRVPTGETKRRLCVLGREGFFREYVPGAGYRDIHIEPVEVGYLEDLRAVGRSLYACGAQGQVYQFDGQAWRPIHEGIHLPFNGQDVERMLLSISGFDEQNLYVCGFEGEVWHFDGRAWSELDSPTNLPLHCVLCGNEGRVFFCGEAGTLIALERDGAWTDLSNKQVSSRAFHDLTMFRDRIYIAAEEQLLYLQADRLQAAPPPESGEWRFLRLDAADDRIWCVGGEEVFDFDGEKWTRHLCPENV